MLTLPFAVPESALTDRETRQLARLTRAAGGVWLRAADGLADGWPAATEPSALALPVGETPVFAPHQGRPALHLAAGENGGLRLPDAVPDPGRWSAAVLWASDEPALALLAVRPDRGGNPIHLSDSEEGLAFRDDDDTAAVTLPRGDAPWRLTVLACANGRLRMAQDGRSASAEGLRVPDGAADLLIGHRSLRRGMRKTLGAGRIAEVWLWPGLDILSDPGAAALRDALDGFRQWEV